MTTGNNSKQFTKAAKKVGWINNFKFKNNRQFFKKCREAIRIKPKKTNFISLDSDYLTSCINVLENGDLMLRYKNTSNGKEKVMLYNITDNELVNWSDNYNSSECKEASLEKDIIYYLNDNDTYVWFSVVLNQNEEVELIIY